MGPVVGCTLGAGPGVLVGARPAVGWTSETAGVAFWVGGTLSWMGGNVGSGVADGTAVLAPVGAIGDDAVSPR